MINVNLPFKQSGIYNELLRMECFIYIIPKLFYIQKYPIKRNQRRAVAVFYF